jgi:hypothetical protein
VVSVTPPHMLCAAEGDEQQNKFVSAFRYKCWFYCACVYVWVYVCVCVCVCVCVAEGFALPN